MTVGLVGIASGPTVGLLDSGPPRGNVNITAIDASGGIAIPRISGQLPFFVHVSGSAITATGTSIPWEDLSFSWDFGDPAGTETFVRPTDGATVNANKQSGPEAAYVYRTAGTYTITLIVTGINTNGHVIATTTQSVTATAQTKSGGEFWADSNAGGTNAGTLANPFTTIAAINTGIGLGFTGASNVTLHVAKGSVFLNSSGVLSNALRIGSNITSAFSGYRIDAYGSGAAPIFESSSGNVPAFYMPNGTGSGFCTISDVVISGIVFRTSGTQAGPQIEIATTSNATAQMSYIYFDNCSVICLNDVAGTVFQIDMDGGDNGLITQGSGLWNCALTGPATAVNSSNNGFHGGARHFGFFFGCTFSGGTKPGGGTTSLECHHIYPGIQEHVLYKWISFGGGTSPRSYCINGNWNTVSGSLEFAQWMCVSECNLTGTNLAVDAGQSNSAKGTFTSGVADISISASFPFVTPQPTVGQQIIFVVGIGGSIPSNFSTGVAYFIVSATGFPVTSIQVSATSGGTAIVANANSSTGTTAPGILRTLFKNVVQERCAYNNLPNDAVVTPDVCQTLTIRDARVWGNTGGRWIGMNGQLANLNQFKFYRNKVYVPSAASAFGAQIDMGGNFTNPLPLAQQVTDNIIQSAQTTAQLVSLPFGSQPAVGSIVDRNQYYAPSDSDVKFLFNNATAVSFAAWQTQLLDVNGSVLAGNPAGWTVPPTQWASFGP